MAGFDDLPQEIAELVLIQLPFRDLIKGRPVCTQWCKYIAADACQKRLFYTPIADYFHDAWLMFGRHRDLIECVNADPVDIDPPNKLCPAPGAPDEVRKWWLNEPWKTWMTRHKYMRLPYRAIKCVGSSRYTCTSEELAAARQAEDWLNPLLLQAFELLWLCSFVERQLVIEMWPWERLSPGQEYGIMLLYGGNGGFNPTYKASPYVVRLAAPAPGHNAGWTTMLVSQPPFTRIRVLTQWWMGEGQALEAHKTVALLEAPSGLRLRHIIDVLGHVRQRYGKQHLKDELPAFAILHFGDLCSSEKTKTEAGLMTPK